MTQIFAREPVFSIDKKLFAYQFLYRNSRTGLFPVDVAHLQQEEEPEHGLSLDDLLQIHMTIVNISSDSLADFGDWFSPTDVIIELSEQQTRPEPELIAQIKQLKNKGFKLVSQMHQSQWPEFLALTDYIKIELLNTSKEQVLQLKQEIKTFDIKIIATQVHTNFQFEQCQLHGIDYVQGFFFLEKRENNKKTVPASKLAYMQLLSEIAKPELNKNVLQSVFEKDPTLSFLLMKFINNPLVNKSFKITSISHALNYLGELMIRRFVAIISLAGLNSDQPSELLNLSLSRAKYCEIVDAEIADNADAMSAFLVGLFSLIDNILEKPIEELLNNLKLDEKIIEALIRKEGAYWNILSSATAIEAGNWQGLLKSSKALAFDQELLFEKHKQAVRWQNEMTTAVSTMYPVAKA
jgi:EAL and modified HD-GYP domain-containing signal transduction protein